ncbi:hypothetical protein [Actinoplanes palleronii]|uniref:Uncharacterized protein n=1 Tax=Actinoplanes palleronii TaxID=113570 RepID=A0ABQ4BNP9_9ACTN|nr:hypothetical protein [Actinoplanes palleronii]GIE72288.1 hypothetical protein Apa02nite_083960 [Actinoplanes palleronii]
MIRETLPERREARWLLAGVLVSSIGRGLTLPFLFIYLTGVRGLSDAAAGGASAWATGATYLIPLATLLALPAVGRRLTATEHDRAETDGYRQVFPTAPSGACWPSACYS